MRRRARSRWFTLSRMDLVRQLRLSKGWSQEQLAEAAEVGRATIQRIESGQVVPGKETALSLASALGVDPVRIRQDAGLAARVLRIATITNTRAPTKSELRPLPPAMRKVFADYAAARMECAALERAMAEAGARSDAAHRERMQAYDRRSQAFEALRANVRDLDASREYLEAVERVNGLAHDTARDEVVEIARKMQEALRVLSETGMAVTRLLFQFL